MAQGNYFDQFDEAPAQGPIVTPLPMSPKDQARESRDNSASARDDTRTAIAVRGEGRDIENKRFEHVTKWADDFNAEPAVKSYRVAATQLAQALGTGEGPQSDLALTYAFAKAMDPDSVVREAEQQMITESQPWFQATVERAKKQFGMDGAGNYTPKARAAMRQQIISSVTKRAKLYDQRRGFYSERAERYGLDPMDIVGPHDGETFIDEFRAYDEQQQEAPQTGPDFDPETGGLNVTVTDDSPGTYQDSYVGQGMSGVNEGIASVIGGPVDLVTAGLNLIPKGLNALAGTDIPQIEDPVLGSEFFKDRMDGWGIFEQTDDPSKQFARRVGESVGAAAIPAGAAGTPLRSGIAMLGGAGGGVGAATAQQAFPNNPLAEFAGEVAGGGVAGLGMFGAGRRAVTREIEEAVPTVPQLKEQAGELYRQAEARGVTAGPMQTEELADAMRGVLRSDGRVSPTGRITDVYPKAKEGMQLVEDYSGQPMSPTQMNIVRKVIAEGMGSADANERRIGSLMTDEFDNFANPLAPEFPQARDIASRYLTAEKLEQARELAEANASGLSQSGIENALRQQYRGLDRSAIKGNSRFNADVVGAIETVSRGTPGGNLARGIGKLAPRGVVSFGLGSAMPAMVAGSMTGSPGVAGAVGLGATTLGELGRFASTKSTKRAADVAELIARNGGKLPEAQVATPELERLTAALAAAEAAKYQTPREPRPRGMFGRR